MLAKVNRSVTLHQGRVFRLVREDVTLKNGANVQMDIIRHPGSSAIVPLPSADRVILIRQYRHAIGDCLWEIPAGTLDPGETPLECAKRELSEEAGFSATLWREMGRITPLPGYTDEQIYMFLATDLRPAEQKFDEDEMLQVNEVPFDRAIAMVHEGTIRDSKTITGLFLAAEWVRAPDMR